MRKNLNVLIGLAILAAAAGGFSAQIVSEKLCCVAGEYRGSHITETLPNCPTPQAEKFTMTIKQDENCTENVWGTVTSPSDGVRNFKGKLKSGPRGCCVLTATIGAPGNIINFTGTFCPKLGKWEAKGTYTEPGSEDPCKQKGTWQVKQI